MASVKEARGYLILLSFSYFEAVPKSTGTSVSLFARVWYINYASVMYYSIFIITHCYLLFYCEEEKASESRKSEKQCHGLRTTRTRYLLLNNKNTNYEYTKRERFTVR